MKYIYFILFLILPITVFSEQNLTNTEISTLIIQQSIRSYSGNCPCPYNTDRRGSSCGRRSAYSRIGGRSPLCYPENVTPQMIQSFKSRFDNN